jgi:ribosomal protein S18 acetylase RimI-like enzyme
MNLQIKPYEIYNEGEILALYESVGWSNYTKEPLMLKQAFANSLKILGAYVDDRLVGILRAVGDGCSIFYIQDILVLPQYQKQGIGRALIKEILKEYPHVYQKVLMTDDSPETIAFYSSLGFKDASEMGIKAFVLM